MKKLSWASPTAFTVILVLACGAPRFPAARESSALPPLAGTAADGSIALARWEGGLRDSTLRKIAATLGVPPSIPPKLDARIIAEATNNAGIERWDVHFQTEPGEDITSTLLIPPERRRHRLPAVLALHQTVPEGRFELVGRSDTLDIGYGWQLARRGFVVLAPDSLAAGDRVEPGQQPWYTSRFYQKHPTWSAIGKAIWDNQRALDYLASLPFVDSKRIGAIGHSQGGVYAMFLAAFDKRVKATFSNSGLITFSSDPNPLRWARDTFWIGMPLMRESLKRRSTPWDMHEVVALIAPRAFFATAAQADKTLPEAAASIVEVENSVKPLYAAYGRADALRTLLFPGEHLFPLENQLLAFEWLEQQLKAPLQR